VSHGWEFFPNSLLLKTSDSNPSDGMLLSVLRAAVHVARRAAENPGLLLLAAAAMLRIAWSVVFDKRGWQLRHAADIVFVVSYIQHIVLARMGWFYRYEAYLVCIGLATAAVHLGEVFTQPRSRMRLAVVGLTIASVGLLGARAVQSMIETPSACLDRMNEHIATIRFVNSYRDSATIVVNDIGAPSFFCPRARILDMFGLGSIEPLRFRRSVAGYSSADLDRWARQQHASFAVLKPEWWREVFHRIPDDWIPVASWGLPQNVVFRDSTVMFFAFDTVSAVGFSAALEGFADSLPAQVRFVAHPWRFGYPWSDVKREYETRYGPIR
jgi:hypothetical protein